MPELDQAVPQKRKCEVADGLDSTVKVQKGNDRQISDADWEKDCEAAFDLALPPTWEFQERKAGTPPGPCTAFPAAEMAQLNAMTRRDQRKGSVKLSGNEFNVDLNLMLAVPVDRKYNPRTLKKTVHKVNSNKKSLKELFLQYAEDMQDIMEHPAGRDAI